MPIINAIASVAVRDLNTAIKWYEALFRKAPTMPMPEVAVAEVVAQLSRWWHVTAEPDQALDDAV